MSQNEPRNASGASASASQDSSRVLVCGVGPLPAGNPDRLHATGIRVWGFARSLAESDLRVDLLEVAFSQAVSGGQAHLHRLGNPAGKAAGGARKAGATVFQGIPIETAPLPPAEPSELIARQIRAESYRAIVSTTDVMNDACARVCGPLPLWCDWFGHPMAERQSMAVVYDSDDGLAAQWDYVLAPLLRADRISGCCDAQRLAILGEWGACGRLNRFTDGREPVVSLPPAVVLRDFQATGTAFRGKTTPSDAFVVLWAGGYNTWADVDTLAAALIEAMQREPAIHFVSAGGAITGHDEKTFVRFREKMDASPVADKCHFAGWVRPDDVPNYYLEADIAVNCDRQHLEAELGTRNRITDWLCAGLPIVSANVCQLARDLSARGLIDAFESGDAAGLADILARAARGSRDAAKARAQKARAYALEFYSPARLFKVMCDWARNPERAPDLAQEAARLPGAPFEIPNNPLARRRAEEWLAAWKETGAAVRGGQSGSQGVEGEPEACCPIVSLVGRAVRRLTRGKECSRL